MAFGSFDRGNANAHAMAEINMVPLIDVMLVLLVIFMVTAPLLTHAVKVDLPRASSAPAVTRPATIQLAIRADGEILWDGQPVDRAALRERLAVAARATPQPEIHLHADQNTAYRVVAETISDAANAGLAKVAFVALPEGR
jgi:biopolymer transport protein ExbD